MRSRRRRSRDDPRQRIRESLPPHVPPASDGGRGGNERVGPEEARGVDERRSDEHQAPLPGGSHEQPFAGHPRRDTDHALAQAAHADDAAREHVLGESCPGSSPEPGQRPARERGQHDDDQRQIEVGDVAADGPRQGRLHGHRPRYRQSNLRRGSSNFAGCRQPLVVRDDQDVLHPVELDGGLDADRFVQVRAALDRRDRADREPMGIDPVGTRTSRRRRRPSRPRRWTRSPCAGTHRRPRRRPRRAPGYAR